ncbi:hypothetical protein GKE82_16275 [Conexibacter sp. W3-3-2]|nr:MULTISPECIES: EcsC family protein [Solirubrobacterales]MTD45804.1 hypothetical protein [Conexibacter sp. W3-3-2]
MSTTPPDHADDGDDGDRPLIPEGIIDRLRADPVRAPETLALAAADQHAPSATVWLDQMRREFRMGPEELAKRAKRRHATLARFGGAATGLGGWVTVVPDLVALAWIQSRVVFYVAGAYGFDPYDPMRPAELLVLQGLYPDPAEARAALDGTGTPVASAFVDKKITDSQDRKLTRTLMNMVGKQMGTRVAGRLIPGVASVFNAVSNERDTRAIADRAIHFYGG